MSPTMTPDLVPPADRDPFADDPEPEPERCPTCGAVLTDG
jgi:hypothetical protein